MTDLTLYEAPHAPDPTGGRLVAWAASLKAAHQIGSALCNTSFVPTTFKGKPEEAAAAILFGDEIGLTPTQSLQSVYVISGKPALYARAMVAIVLAAGHEVETVEKSDAVVSVRGRRRGSETWIVETWTKARAVKAGYTNNKKYETDPSAMLYARAASDLCRQIAPDALAGIGYSVEELEVAETTKVTVTRASATDAPAKVQRKAAAPAPEPPEPSFDEPGVDTETGEIVDAEIVEEPPARGFPPVSGSQLTKMSVLFNANGIKDRDDRLAYVATVVGRDVDSSKSLDKAEASAVIDALEAMTVEVVEPTLDEVE